MSDTLEVLSKTCREQAEACVSKAASLIAAAELLRATNPLGHGVEIVEYGVQAAHLRGQAQAYNTIADAMEKIVSGEIGEAPIAWRPSDGHLFYDPHVTKKKHG